MGIFDGVMWNNKPNPNLVESLTSCLFFKAKIFLFLQKNESAFKSGKFLLLKSLSNDLDKSLRKL